MATASPSRPRRQSMQLDYDATDSARQEDATGRAGLSATSLRTQQILQSAEYQRSEMNAAKRASRLSSKPLPEVHIIGEVCGGTGFGSSPVCCKWELETGARWEWVEGARSGQTHTASPDGSASRAIWAHPLDVHYVAGAVQGWPRLIVQVWMLDSYGRLDLAGYGFCHIPTAPGEYELSCPTWRPVGTPAQEFAAYFLGGAAALRSTAVVYEDASQRYRLTTATAGDVHIRVQVLTRHMELYSIEA